VNLSACCTGTNSDSNSSGIAAEHSALEHGCPCVRGEERQVGKGVRNHTRVVIVAKETKPTPNRIHFTGMTTDNEAYAITYSVPTTGHDFTVRVAKKDRSVTQVTPQKKP
jgi:hypothetical protein